MRNVAESCVDRRNSCAAVDRTFLDIAARVDPKPHEDRRPAGPSVEKVARNIATTKHGSREVRRLGDSIVAAAGPVATPAAISVAAGARARPRGV
jgi:hypothetical protein